MLPVVRRLAAAGARGEHRHVKAEVAGRRSPAGAVIVNDVLRRRPTPTCSTSSWRAGAGYVLMHSRGTPQRHGRSLTGYDDVVAEVFEFLADGLDRCAEAGIALDRIIVDPGIGFAKDADAQPGAAAGPAPVPQPGPPGPRRRVAQELPRRPCSTAAARATAWRAASAVAAAAAVADAAIVRVHDVAATVQAVRTARAIASGDRDWPSAIA